jgi:hypothetical protein
MEEIQYGGYKPIPEPTSPAQMEALSRDDQTRLMAQRSAQSARATLVRSLCILGNFPEALRISNDPTEREWIKRVQASEICADDERCECVHLIDVADYTRNENAKPQMEPGRKFSPGFRYWSTHYGQMVWAHTCVVCGFVNSLPEDNLNA